MKHKYKLGLLLFLMVFIVSSLFISANEKDINKSKIKSLVIKEIVDGLAPFDKTDERGSDSNSKNKTVRSFDSVSYTLEYVTEIKGTDVVNDGYLMVEFRLEHPKEVATFDMNTMAWIVDAKLTEKDGVQILTGKRYLKNTTDNNAIPGAGTLSTGVKVQAAQNGTKIQPTFKVWMEGNPESEKLEIKPDIVTVTAAPKYNLRLDKHTTLDYLGYFNLEDGVETTKEDIDSKLGRIQGYGLNLELYNDSESKGLKGIEFPKGEISFDVTLNELIKNQDVSTEEGFTPIIWDYKENMPGNKNNPKGKWGRYLMHRNDAVNTYNYSKSPGNKLGNTQQYCYDGGTIKIEQTELNKYKVTIKDYKFDMNNFIFPGYGLSNSLNHAPVFKAHQGIFSVGFIQVLCQVPKDRVSEITDINLSVNLDNFNATSMSDTKVTEEVTIADNKKVNSITLYPPGTISKSIRMVDENKKVIASNNGADGDASRVVGSDFYAWNFMYRKSDYPTKALNYLFKFDDEGIEIANKKLDITHTSPNGYLGDYKLLYAGKKDKTGWNNDDEMIKTKQDDLVYFKTKEELELNGYTCVGCLVEIRNSELWTIGDNRICYIAIPLKIKENAVKNKTYAMVGDYYIWENEGINYTKEGNPSEPTPKATAKSEVNDYGKTEYDENGIMIPGTHRGGHLKGNSILAVGYESNIKKEISTLLEDGKPKTIYDMDKTERTISFKLTPSIDTKGSSVSFETNLYITDTLPKDLTYNVGSATYNGRNFEPEVTKKEDGTTLLKWNLENVKTTDKIPSIEFSCTIGKAGTTDDVKNNQIIVNQASIKGTDDKRPQSLESGNISEVGFNIIKLNAISISKNTDTPFVKSGEEFNYNLRFSNNSEGELYNANLYDVLPYNKDSRNTSFHGDYDLTSIIFDFSTAPKTFDRFITDDYYFEYTKDKGIQGVSYEKLEEYKNWNKISDKTIDRERKTVTFQNIPQDITGLKLSTSLSGLEYINIQLNLVGTNNELGDVYVNNFYEDSESQSGVVTSNPAVVQIYDLRTVKKVWNDNNDQDGFRPEFVEVGLFADGVEIERVQLNKNNNWTYTNNELPMYTETGKAISYEWKEINVPEKYEASYQVSEKSTTITNRHTPETRNISISKFWNDNLNQDGIRPEKVELTLYGNNKVIGSYSLNELNNWEKTISNLPVYENGEKINYRVDELNIPKGYTKTINEFVVSNYHKPETKDLTINKVWDDENDQDKIRPSKLEIELLADNKVLKTITLNESNHWTETIQELPVYKTGRKINYEFVEKEVPEDYEARYEVTGNTTTITNYHDTKKTKVSVSKEWNDLNDADGIRPEMITIDLYANDTIVKENVEIKATENWEYKFLNLPFNKNGKRINYTVVETVPEGYKAVYDVNVTEENTDIKITNSHEWKKTDLKVNKEWQDGNNSDGLRPFRIKLELTANGEVLEKDLFLSKANNWTYETKQLPLNKKGVRIDYQFHEKAVPSEYTVSYDKKDVEIVGVTTKTNTTITNIHDYETVSVRAEKYWNDNNNADGLRPDSVTVQLLADEKELNRYTLNPENHWSITVTGLPKEIDGKEIQYEFKELNTPEGYTVDYEIKDNVTKITNTHIHEVKALSVEKVWKDTNNADGLRPKNIEVNLFANNEIIETFNLSKDNDWKAEIYNLPVKEQGEVINYEFQEKAIPKGYTVNYEVKDNHTTITNTHEIETTSAFVEKIWNDENDADNLRPESIEVELFANESKVSTYTLSNKNDWKLTVTDLPAKANGEMLTYTFKEKNTPKGYEVSYKQDGNKIIITNTHKIERTNASVKHIWQDENDIEGFRPEEITVILYGNNEPITEVVLSDKVNWEYKLNHLPKNEKGQPIQYRFVLKESIPRYTSTAEYEDDRNHSMITSVHVPELVTLELEKTWNDSDNADGLRPSNIQVDLKQNGVNFKELTLNENNNWQLEINELPKYRNGKELEYTFKEKDIPTGYEVSYKTVDNKTVITNTHEQEHIDLEVQKEWDDNHNQDNLRPTEISVKLYANGKELKDIDLNNKNNWIETIKDLPKNENGTEIQYEFKETVIPEGYEVDYNIIENKTIITNTHEVGKTAVAIQKIWDDKNNADNIRPKNIEVGLYANKELINEITLNNSNEWQTVVHDLPLKENGESIHYEVKELNIPNGYTSNIERNENTFEITNTHIPETVTAKVEKYWQDENDLDKLRPSEIDVVLHKNNQPTDKSLILSEENNWKGEINDLPKYENGEEIDYSYQLKESIPEYTSSYYQSGNITQITSIHKIPKVNLTVSEIWNDENNADGLRPQNIEVGFYVNGIQQQIIKLNELNDWTATMSNLRQFINSKEVQYEFVELTKVEGYTTETVVKNNETVITNTHIPEKTTAKVEKVWIDNNNADGLRPTEVEVVLLKNGKPTDKTLILSEKTDWKGQIDNLIKNENGEEIVYGFILKEDVPEYMTSSENLNSPTTITSVHDSIKTETSVQKIWKDNNSSKRPESITVVLYQNGEPTEKQVILNKENNWQATISDLLKYENGEEIVYTFVEEDIPKGYSNSTEIVEGVTVITNTLERPIINNPDTPDEHETPIKQPEQVIKETITKEPVKTDGTATPVKTNDTTNVVLLVSLLGLGVLGIVMKKHKK